jgi:hypothetical protein
MLTLAEGVVYWVGPRAEYVVQIPLTAAQADAQVERSKEPRSYRLERPIHPNNHPLHKREFHSRSR